MLRFTARILLILGLLCAGFTAAPPVDLHAQDFVLGETSVLVPANGQVSLQFETFAVTD